MSHSRVDQPPNLRSLTMRIDNLSRETDRPVRRIQRLMANTVVGQMLPAGVVKGGTAMKLRVGEAGSRFTPDLDASYSEEIPLDRYIDLLADHLAAGWGGFTAVVEEQTPPQPEGVPTEYVMRPFTVRLAYRGRHWLTVPFELGHDEIGSTSRPDHRIAGDIVEVFEILGIETPQPVPVLAVDHQIAQKLHACTAVDERTRRNDRAHDLVDLQILDQDEHVDMPVVGSTCARLFAARRGHSWPPTVVAYDGWESIYAEAAIGLDVLDNVDQAVEWANAFIARAVD